MIKKNFVSFWCDAGSSPEFFSVTKNCLAKEDIKNLLAKYHQADKTIRLSSNEFLNDKCILFELWSGNNPIGILSVTVNFSWELEDLDPDHDEEFVSIALDSVFIIEDYKGKGLGVDLANVSSNDLALFIANKISNYEKRKNDLEIYASAEFHTIQGEAFFYQFMSKFEDEDFIALIKDYYLETNLTIDAGY